VPKELMSAAAEDFAAALPVGVLTAVLAELEVVDVVAVTMIVIATA
jgi:hypothetical protein